MTEPKHDKNQEPRLDAGCWMLDAEKNNNYQLPRPLGWE